MAKTAEREGQFTAGRQVIVGGIGVPTANKSPKDSASMYRDDRWSDKDFPLIMRDPTVRLAVDVITAMLMRVPWAVEGEDNDQCNFLWAQFEPYREQLIRSAFVGFLTRGWRSFEVRYNVEHVEYKGDPQSLRQTISGLKALRSGETDVLVDEETGDFVGLINRDPKGNAEFIDREHSLLVNFDDDGYGDLGYPLLRTVTDSWRKWNTCDAGAQRYDAKVAGGFTFIQYPVGATAKVAGGEKIDHSILMRELGEAYESAGWGGVPVDIDPETNETIESAWKMERITDGGGLQPSFIARLKYLDALKLRAFGIPERAVTEGTFGTKAEAEAHADIPVLINLERLKIIISAVNKYLVEPFNDSNWGDPGACRFMQGKMDPDDRAMFQTIFTGLMSDPVFGEQIAAKVDLAAMLDKLNVPVVSKESFSDSGETT